MSSKVRAFLKWAGGKYGLVEEINRRLPSGDTLVEPFVGAGSVFINSDYKNYRLNDINPDLIGLYQLLADQGDRFIAAVKPLFSEQHNTPEAYYHWRQVFNQSADPELRSRLFLYLNRHGYNGLCRYNKKGAFNVPFGRYKRPYFPEKEMAFFAEKAKRATFTCMPFAEVMRATGPGDVVYCDPPYWPLSPTASFTSYHGAGFNRAEQESLALVAQEVSSKNGVPVLISNHEVTETRALYAPANLDIVRVKRTISRNGSGRQKVSELLAFYEGRLVAE
ncbi:Dam family site-specific DNA-(adenine-N6)-methyltransferase [Corallincola luteus]|uniref:Site-specific DNA-methyltransferase (adenine-specific) n=2 Tax=Corallincola TaxID=1775176 RepID=A0A368N689_9GAMM|nr:MULTISPECIES: Dam family site-specific DNA-(adenine-N6)-methyltransferase [Corallincola]RCU45074.1 Dam family site-specific DNA-(adenine-N6)-methyltransferase [Corallincola holothuriorum]TCI04525.1 Dam family site-specific DNA-(adenine-N6)-methyltransferase [Corallincola luteus]